MASITHGDGLETRVQHRSQVAVLGACLLEYILLCLAQTQPFCGMVTSHGAQLGEPMPTCCDWQPKARGCRIGKRFATLREQKAALARLLTPCQSTLKESDLRGDGKGLCANSGNAKSPMRHLTIATCRWGARRSPRFHRKRATRAIAAPATPFPLHTHAPIDAFQPPLTSCPRPPPPPPLLPRLLQKPEACAAVGA